MMMEEEKHKKVFTANLVDSFLPSVRDNDENTSLLSVLLTPLPFIPTLSLYPVLSRAKIAHFISSQPSPFLFFFHHVHQ